MLNPRGYGPRHPVFEDPMSKAAVNIDGKHLSITAIAQVARSGQPVGAPQGSRYERSMRSSVQLKDALISKRVPIYGVTTGYGDSANRQIDPAHTSALQENLVRMMGCGRGDFAPLDEARATTLIRANCLARGHSAVRPVIVERLLDLLNNGITPAIRERGSVGASGDLVPLSYVAAALQGKRQVFFEGRLQPTLGVFGALGIAPVELESKEALGLLNGTAYMTGIASLAAYDAATIALTADIATAMTAEVLRGMTSPFSEFVHDVAKPHQGQIRSAANIRAMLTGSQLVREEIAYRDDGSTSASGFRTLPERVQDRYSVRCAPHFIGSLWDTLTWVTQWLETEVNSSTDNPLFDVEEGRVHNGGNFAGSHVGLASDALRTAIGSVADLIDRQFALIVDEKSNAGLPANLAKSYGPGDREAGTRHGLKGMQIACSSFVAEALHLCAPVTVFSRSTECHNQDKVSMATISARRTRDVARLTEEVLACHLIGLCQAAEYRGVENLGLTSHVYERIRKVSASLEGDRELEDDIERVVQLIRSRELFAGLPLSQKMTTRAGSSLEEAG